MRPKDSIEDRLARGFAKTPPNGSSYSGDYSVDETGRRLRFGFTCSNGHTQFKAYFTYQRTGCTDCSRQERHERPFTKLLALNPEFDVVRLNDKFQLTCTAGHAFTRKTVDAQKQCPVCKKHRTKALAYAAKVESYAEVLDYSTRRLRCLACKTEYTHGDRIHGSTRCPGCYKNPARKTLAQWQQVYKERKLGVVPIAEEPDGYTMRCTKGHEFKLASLGNFTRCSMCSGNDKVSTMHAKLIGWLERRAQKVVSNARVLENKRLALDIFLPEHNLAIEVDGEFWHREDANTRLLRRRHCENKGIQLLRFYDSELGSRSVAVLALLHHRLKLTSKTIGARQCVVNSVPSSDTKAFLDRWHIQGSVGASVAYTLSHEGKILAVMTFGRPRMTKAAEWELVRFCVRGGYNVPGAASRLLAAFEREHSPSSLVSYADRRYSVGSLYLNLGFKLSHISNPGYFYVGNNQRVSRYAAQKHKLSKLLPVFSSALSESDNMEANGYHKVYDCGQLVFVKGDISLPKRALAPKVVEKRVTPRTRITKEQLLAKLSPGSKVKGSAWPRSERVQITCPAGHTYEASAYSVLRATKGGCHKCCNRLPLADMLHKLKQMNPDMEYISGYESATVPCKFRYKKTGIVFLKKPHQLLTGRVPHAAKRHR